MSCSYDTNKMKYNPQIHHRRSVRLKGYDYSQEGAYFITVCVKNRECVFGHIMNEGMTLNDIGKIANEYLQDIPNHFSHVEMGEFIVMPNHVHCVLVLHKPTDDVAGTRHVVSLPDNTGNTVGTSHVMSLQQPNTSVRTRHVVSQQISQLNQFSKPIPGSVSVIIQQYKSSVKRWCNKNKHEHFQWQSRFHDHVIRNEQSYQNISNYIINNPTKWNEDKFFVK